MKTKQALAILLLSILPLTACGTRTEDVPTKSHTAVSRPSSKPVAQPATEEPKETERDEDAFLIVARHQDMSLGLTDTELVKLGDAACDALERGATDAEILAVLVDDYGYDESGQIFAASTAFLCPNQT